MNKSNNFLSIILNPCHEIDSESCLKIHRQVALLMTTEVVADFLPGSPLLTGLLRYFLIRGRKAVLTLQPPDLSLIVTAEPEECNALIIGIV